MQPPGMEKSSSGSYKAESSKIQVNDFPKVIQEDKQRLPYFMPKPDEAATFKWQII